MGWKEVAVQFVNDPREHVAQGLAGLERAWPQLVRWNREPSFVVRADGNPAHPPKVALVAGGGSGHEPLHTGFVGEGMLDAAGADAGADVVIDAAAARAWAEAFMAAVDEQAAELNELDRRSGDGDFGSNVEAAVARARARLEGAGSVAGVFEAFSGAFLDTGGTSGPLYGMWFRALARAATDEAIGLAALAAGTADGLATVQRLGRAEVGDKTMVDAMAPAAYALADAGELAEGLRAAARAAREGAASTEAIAARRGRASYVGDVARGVLDPGAVTVALFFESAPMGDER